MLTRSISAVVGMALFALLCFSGPLPFAIGITLLAAAATWEFVSANRMASVPDQPDVQDHRTSSPGFNLVLAAIGLLYPMLPLTSAIGPAGQLHDNRHPDFLGVLLPAIVVLVLSGRLIQSWHGGSVMRGLRRHYGLIAFAYIWMLSSSVVGLRLIGPRSGVHVFGDNQGAWIVLMVATCVWAADSFALIIGRAWGAHKLAPSLSPGKTWEGAGAGIVGAVVAGALMRIPCHLSLATGLMLGLIAGLMGPVGDLFESALKRELNIKDFGKLIPGHGGVLDRIDSMLFVAPMAWLYIHLVFH